MIYTDLPKLKKGQQNLRRASYLHRGACDQACMPAHNAPMRDCWSSFRTQTRLCSGTLTHSNVTRRLGLCGCAYGVCFINQHCIHRHADSHAPSAPRTAACAGASARPGCADIASACVAGPQPGRRSAVRTPPAAAARECSRQTPEREASSSNITAGTHGMRVVDTLQASARVTPGRPCSAPRNPRSPSAHDSLTDE